MGTCPTPCDTSKNGVCVIRGQVKSCEGAYSIADLEALLEEADKICLVPDEVFTIDAIRDLVLKMRNFGFVVKKNGIVEISKQLRRLAREQGGSASEVSVVSNSP